MAEATRKRKAPGQLKRATKKPRKQIPLPLSVMHEKLKAGAIASKLPQACESSAIPYDVWIHHILPLVPWEMAQVAFGFSNLCATFDFSLVVPYDPKSSTPDLAVGVSIRGDYVTCCWPSSDADEQTSVYSFPWVGTKTEEHNRPVFYFEPWFITNYFSDTFVWNAEYGSLVMVPTSRHFSSSHQGANWITVPGADYVFLNYDSSYGDSNEIYHLEMFMEADCLLVEPNSFGQVTDLVAHFPKPRDVHLRNHCYNKETPTDMWEFTELTESTARVPRIGSEVENPKMGPVMHFDECNNAFDGKLQLVDKTADQLSYFVGLLFNVRTGSYICLYSPYNKAVEINDINEEHWLCRTQPLLQYVNAHNSLFKGTIYKEG